MKTRHSNNQAGFSLIELIISMGITVSLMGLASALLAGGFNARSREDRKSDAVADAQRALNIMTREISNGGFKLPSGLGAVSTNGVVTSDSDTQSIRIVSNLNGMPESANGYFEDPDLDDTDEDIKFLMYVDNALEQRYIVRYEKNGTNQTTVLANRVDSLVFRYFGQKVTYDTFVDNNGNCDIRSVVNASGAATTEVSPGAANFVVIAVGVTLPAVGVAGSEGYQPPSRVQLTSDVVLRNSIIY